MRLDVYTVALALGAAVCGSALDATAAAALSLSSPVIAPDQPLPSQLTCDGAGSSPPLAWSEPPGGTRSFALIVDDPDAPGGTYAHWVVYDIPPNVRRVDAGHPPDGARLGLNGRHQATWTSPCPPNGMHHYDFALYALDTMLHLNEPTEKDVQRAMQGHVLAQARLVGTYERPGH